MSVPVTNQERKIKAANILMCVFIVVHHVLHMTIQEIPPDIIWKITDCIYDILSIGITGAVLICGVYLAHSYGPDESRSRHIKCIKSAFLPYLVAVCVYWVILFIFGESEMNPRLLVIHIISGNLTTHFFLPIMIVQFIILFPLISKVFAKFNIYLIMAVALLINGVSVLISGMFEFLNPLFTNYLYVFLLGSYIGMNFNKFEDFAASKFKIICTLFILITVLLEFLVYPLGAEFKSLLQLVKLIFYPFAAVFWMALCIKLTPEEEPEKVSAFYSVISGSTYYIYLWYAIFLLITNMYIHQSETVSVVAGFAIRSAVTAFGVGLIIFVRYLINRKQIKEG